jgi:hypothetical protein
MEISITKAGQEWGISRVTLHKKIKDGVLSKQENGTLESSEMLRVFGEPKVKVSSESDVNVYRDLQLRIQHLESDLQLQKELTRKGEERETWLQTQVGNLTDTMKLLDAPKSQNSGFGRTRLLIAVCVVAALVAAGVFALRAAHYL